ncbi:signal peptidase I [bacterium]|nr:MAG: signal peptidase I [bacterium]
MIKDQLKDKNSKTAALRAQQQEIKKEQTFKEKTTESVKSFAWALGVFYFVQTFFLQAFTIPTSSMVSTLLVGDFIFVNKCVYGAQTPENIPFTGIQLPRYRFPSFKEPEQGDVVVFRFPHPELANMEGQLGLDYIKRCVAAAGQTLEIKNKELYVDGKLFSESFDFPGIHYYPYDPNSGATSDVFPKTMGTGENFGPLRIPAKGDLITISPNNDDFIKYLALRDHKQFERRADGYYVDGIKADSYEVGQDYYFMMGDNRDNSLDSRFWGPVPRDHVAGEGLFIYWSNVEAAKQTNYILKLFSTLNLSKVNWKRIGTIIR